MSVLLLLLFLGPIAFACGVSVALVIAAEVSYRARRRRSRRRGMTDREIVNSIDPGAYGVDISVWPQRAPRNGATEDVP
jgi:hypothetical protein